MRTAKECLQSNARVSLTDLLSSCVRGVGILNSIHYYIRWDFAVLNYSRSDSAITLYTVYSHAECIIIINEGAF